MSADVAAQKPGREDFRWDVFLSYRHADKSAVQQIAMKLRDDRRLKVWWDEWEVPPGGDFQQGLWAGLKESWATAVFIGPSTTGGCRSAKSRAPSTNKSRAASLSCRCSSRRPDPDKIDLEFLGLNSRVVFERSLTSSA